VLLLTAHLELTKHLEDAGARVVPCPKLDIQPPESFTALDEAIENLYGYDWLIFGNVDSVRFFLQRLEQQEHEISELDSLKVCAIGELTRTVLEEARVHVDVESAQLDSATVVEALATYLGGADSLRGLNFLIPQSTIGRDYLKDHLEEAGARADVIAAYRTAAASDSRLVRLRTLLLSGGIDCVVFADASEVHSFARLFDTNDLGALLSNVALAALDEETAETAARFKLATALRPAGRSGQSLAEAIAGYYSS
jgi:uroporphyrinogen III methyltransferase/synthase